MNAAVARVETRVTAEDRIARIESDVAEIKDDVKTINIRLNESIVANAREFGAVRAEIEKHRTDTEKGFGGLRVEIEKVRTSIVSAKLWMVLFCIGSLGSLLMSVLNFISHASRSP